MASPSRHAPTCTVNSTGPKRRGAPAGTAVQMPGTMRIPETHVPLLEVSSRTISCPSASRSVAWTPLTRGSRRKMGHWAGSRPTRTSEPACTENWPAVPRMVAASQPWGAAGDTGWAFIGPVTGNPGTLTPPPPFVTSLPMGCPQEKQKDGCPGVAIVFIPHAGQRTWTTGGAAVVPQGSAGGGASACCDGGTPNPAGAPYPMAAAPPGAAAVAAKGSAMECIPYPPGGAYPPPPGGAPPYPPPGGGP